MENGTAGDTSAFDASVDRISAMLGDTVAEPDAPEPPADAAPADPVAETAPAEPVALDVPKSWPKEMHEHWGTTPRQVQEYWGTREKQMLDGLTQYKTDAEFARNFRQALNPYAQTLKKLNIDELTAAKQLFQADHLLRYSTPEEKRTYFNRLAQTYGIDLNGQAQPSAPVDPKIHFLETQLQRVQANLDARDKAERDAAYDKVSKEVEAFASDKAHPYFSEVQDHITTLLHGSRAAGKELSLQDAYDQAVWANPITRAKELAKAQTEHEAKLKENARLEALPKKRAAGVNVKASDSDRAPTEPLGTIEETIRKAHRAMKERTH